MPRAFLGEGVDADVLARVRRRAARARRRAAPRWSTSSCRTRRYGIPVYYLIATAEASSNLARYDGVRYGHRAQLDDATTRLREMYDRTRDEGFGAEVKRRIMLGTYVLSAGYYDAYYLKAQQVRTLLRQDYEHAFERVDVVAMPTTPTPAFRLGEKTERSAADVLERHLHGEREPHRPAGDQRAVRILARPSCRSACS